MREDTEQLIRTARQTLDDANDVRDDELLMPNAAALADAAAFLHERSVAYAGLVEKLRHYLHLAGEYAQSEHSLRAGADFYMRLADTWDPKEIDHRDQLRCAGSLLLKVGDLKKSRKVYEKAVILAERYGDEREVLSTRMNLVGPLAETGDATDAYEMIHGCVELAYRRGWRKLEVSCNTNAAMTAFMLGRMNDALRFSQRAIDVGRRADVGRPVFVAMQVQAKLLIQDGRLDEGAELLRSVANEPTLDARTRAIAWGNLGAALVGNGDYSEGEAALKEALAIFHEEGLRLGIAQTAQNFGAALVEQGLYERAIPYLKQAETEFAALGDTSDLCFARLNLATALIHTTRIEEAAGILEKDQPCSESPELEVRTGWLEVSGELAMARRDYRLAAAYFEESLELARKADFKLIAAGAAYGLAAARLKLKDFDRAIEAATGVCDTLNNAERPSPRLIEAALLVADAVLETRGAKAAQDLIDQVATMVEKADRNASGHSSPRMDAIHQGLDALEVRLAVH